MRGDPGARDPRRARDRHRGGDGDGAGRAQLGRGRRGGAARGARRCARAARRLAADGGQPGLGARALRRGHRRGRAATPDELRAALAALARRIHDDEVARCLAMGAPRRRAALAGRAGCSRTATRARSPRAATARRSASCAPRTRAIPGLHVWVDETRPLLQGARLTAWELAEDGIPHTLIADVAAGQLFSRGLVDAVVFGADRIARNGDAANKIGSYTLSVLARRPRRAVLRRGAVLDDRSRDRGRRGDPDRGARRRRGRAARRHGRSRLRARRSRTPPSTSRRRPTSPRS